MLFRLTALLLAPALIPAAFGQDERRAASPDGRIEFRIFVAPQAPGDLFRLAYQVAVEGKPVIARSYVALDIWNQDPLLGENDGLIGSRAGSGPGYNSLVAEYMQNGSLGRLINVEARVYNDGVAFRYILPRSTPLIDLLIADEATEFRFAQKIAAQESQPPPFVTPFPGVGFVAISEVRAQNFPAMSLARLDASTLVTRLATKPADPTLAFEGTTPFTGPWRVITFGADRGRLQDSPLLRSLKP